MLLKKIKLQKIASETVHLISFIQFTNWANYKFYNILFTDSVLLSKNQRINIFLNYMNFTNINPSKLFKTFFSSHLLTVQYVNNKIQFSIFNQTQSEQIKKTVLSNQVLHQSNQQNAFCISLIETYQTVKKNLQNCIEIAKNTLLLNIKLSNPDESFNVCLTFKQLSLTQKESIFYLKQYNNAKDQMHKGQILRLKSKIYCLMIEVQDATNLIKSQSYQTKNCREQVKNLKKQLKIMQEQKKKQQETSFTQVGIQHDFLQNLDDTIDCLQTCQTKQFNHDKERLNHLTMFIQQQIEQNEKIIVLNENCGLHTNTELKRVMSQGQIFNDGESRFIQENLNVESCQRGNNLFEIQLSPLEIHKSDLSICEEEIKMFKLS